jgi:GT2 family glycosyltransferase
MAVTVAVCIASYNRRETTLRCLRSLTLASTSVDIETYLCDDSSTDGTAAAVREEFPLCHVVAGDGHLFWCGGMRAAMRAASKSRYDFLLWLNDDVQLWPGFLDQLLSEHEQAQTADRAREHVIVGAVVDPKTRVVTYSGLRRTSIIHPAKFARVPPVVAAAQLCDTFNGNCVLFPRRLVFAVGEIDPAYIQDTGDLDYGYRCAAAGANIWVAREPVGSCLPNYGASRWSDRTLSITDRWRILNTPHGAPYRPWIRFLWRYGGVLAVAWLLVTYTRGFVWSIVAATREKGKL